MKKIILIPDSFKGTMTSEEICDIMEQSIKNVFPASEIIKIPVADGGEGSVDAFLSASGGIKKKAIVKGPYFEETEAFYGLIDNGKTAVIEMAACAGLPLVNDKKNPQKTTTYGVGQLMILAAHDGAEQIIVGLGGSATNDGGTGAAAAAGIKFYKENGEFFIPTGGTLKDICRIDNSGLDPILKNIKIMAMCDIDNPLCGEHGASHIFGPQKGADPEMVAELDKGLYHLSETVKKDIGADKKDMPGAGAAGGMGFGMEVFFGAKLQMGIETVLDTVKFDEIVRDADFVISGEGKIDTQSIRGKVVIGVAKRAKKAWVPLIAVVGDIGDGIEKAYDMGVSSIFSINRVAVDFSKAKKRAKNDLALTVDNIMRFIKTVKG